MSQDHDPPALPPPQLSARERYHQAQLEKAVKERETEQKIAQFMTSYKAKTADKLYDAWMDAAGWFEESRAEFHKLFPGHPLPEDMRNYLGPLEPAEGATCLVVGSSYLTGDLSHLPAFLDSCPTSSQITVPPPLQPPLFHSASPITPSSSIPPPPAGAAAPSLPTFRFETSPPLLPTQQSSPFLSSSVSSPLPLPDPPFASSSSASQYKSFLNPVSSSQPTPSNSVSSRAHSEIPSESSPMMPAFNSFARSQSLAPPRMPPSLEEYEQRHNSSVMMSGAARKAQGMKPLTAAEKELQRRQKEAKRVREAKEKELEQKAKKDATQASTVIKFGTAKEAVYFIPGKLKEEYKVSKRVVKEVCGKEEFEFELQNLGILRGFSAEEVESKIRAALKPTHLGIVWAQEVKLGWYKSVGAGDHWQMTPAIDELKLSNALSILSGEELFKFFNNKTAFLLPIDGRDIEPLFTKFKSAVLLSTKAGEKILAAEKREAMDNNDGDEEKEEEEEMVSEQEIREEHTLVAGNSAALVNHNAVSGGYNEEGKNNEDGERSEREDSFDSTIAACSKSSRCKAIEEAFGKGRGKFLDRTKCLICLEPFPTNPTPLLVKLHYHPTKETAYQLCKRHQAETRYRKTLLHRALPLGTDLNSNNNWPYITDWCVNKFFELEKDLSKCFSGETASLFESTLVDSTASLTSDWVNIPAANISRVKIDLKLDEKFSPGYMGRPLLFLLQRIVEEYYFISRQPPLDRQELVRFGSSQSNLAFARYVVASELAVRVLEENYAWWKSFLNLPIFPVDGHTLFWTTQKFGLAFADDSLDEDDFQDQSLDIIRKLFAKRSNNTAPPSVSAVDLGQAEEPRGGDPGTYSKGKEKEVVGSGEVELGSKRKRMPSARALEAEALEAEASSSKRVMLS
ncbi:hypothetical protein JCM5350_003156 [Sporobolomyces pararoseus]